MEASELIEGIAKAVLLVKGDAEAVEILERIGKTVEDGDDNAIREDLKKLWTRVRRLEEIKCRK